MIKLGEFRHYRGRERINFRDWVEKGHAKTGRYSVRVIFPPQKFPTFSVIFEDQDWEVRITLKSEKMKEVFKALGLELKKANLPALVFEVIQDENGLIYGLDLDSIDKNLLLVWKGTYWIRQLKEDDLDLDLEL
jgi:hypothetical protein